MAEIPAAAVQAAMRWLESTPMRWQYVTEDDVRNILAAAAPLIAEQARRDAAEEIARLRDLIDTYKHPDAPRTVNAWRDYAKHWRDRAERSEPDAALALLRKEPARIRSEITEDEKALIGWAVDRLLAALPAPSTGDPDA